MRSSFQFLWLGQLVSNLGTQLSLFGLGLWSFSQGGQLFDFAIIAFIVGLSKIFALPLLRTFVSAWPLRLIMLLGNLVGALCTIGIVCYLMITRMGFSWQLLPLMGVSAMSEAALVISFASLIPLIATKPKQLARATGLFAVSDGLILSVAPFCGSWLLSSAGLRGIFAVDISSFILASVVLLLSSTPHLSNPLFKTLRDQRSRLRLSFMLTNPTTRTLLFLGGAMSFVYAAVEL